MMIVTAAECWTGAGEGGDSRRVCDKWKGTLTVC